MRRIVFFISIALLLCSCSSTYYYATMGKAVNDFEAELDTIGGFVIERDSFTIAYTFNGWEAPVNISIFNKGKLPIFVDWAQSAMIVDSTAYSYAGEGIDYNSTTLSKFDFTAMVDIRYGDYAEYMKAASALRQTVNVVTPGKWSRFNPVNITLPDFNKIKNKQYGDSFLQNKFDENIRVRKIYYTDKDTPIKFGSLLTIYTDPDKPNYIDNHFYLANLIKAKSFAPERLPASLAKRGDLFSVIKEANNTGWYVAAMIPLVVVGLIVGDPEEKQYYEDDDY